MSVFLRRSLCLSCPRFTLARTFFSTQPILYLETTANGALKSKRTRKKKDEASRTPAPVPRNLLVDSPTQKHLDAVSRMPDLTLDQFERGYKPFIRPYKTDPNYEEEYHKVIERLIRSFSFLQLRNFVKQYKLDSTAKPSKHQAAAMIVEQQWRWPSPASVRQEKTDAEIIHQSFPLNAKHAFLILGKDGGDLLDLSVKFGLHISFSPNPLSLRAEGSRASLRRFAEFINDFTQARLYMSFSDRDPLIIGIQGVKEQLFRLPSATNLESDSLQRISRVSGAFVETAEEGSIRLTYKKCDDRAANSAKRLILQSLTEVRGATPTLIYSAPTQPQPSLDPSVASHPTYSFYPFVSLQFKSQTNPQQGLFRVRRVEHWLKSNMVDDTNNELSGLEDASSAMDFSGNPVVLRKALATQFTDHQAGKDLLPTRITASFGHILCSGSSGHSGIMPPLLGSQELSQVLEWLQNNEPKRVFAASLPNSLINSAPSKQRLIHRLIYRPLLETNGFAESSFKFELVLDVTDPSTSTKTESSDQGSSENSLEKQDAHPFSLAPICFVETTARLDLMLPDRPMDIRLSSSRNRIISDEDWPEGFKSYFDKFQLFLNTPDHTNERPDAPLTLIDKGVEYLLSSSSTVRQTLDPVPNIPRIPNFSPHIIAESISELENKERSHICQVTCDDITSDASWSSFLEYCDALLSPAPKTRRWNF